eukprot:3245932-Prymnesium_polylepis.1
MRQFLNARDQLYVEFFSPQSAISGVRSSRGTLVFLRNYALLGPLKEQRLNYHVTLSCPALTVEQLPRRVPAAAY